MSDTWRVTGAELLRRLRKLARKRGLDFGFDAKRGKGDHGTIRLGGRKTILPGTGELKTGTLHSMLRDLGLRPDDLRK
jgi:mRNA interferase HicA